MFGFFGGCTDFSAICEFIKSCFGGVGCSK